MPSLFDLFGHVRFFKDRRPIRCDRNWVRFCWLGSQLSGGFWQKLSFEAGQANGAFWSKDGAPRHSAVNQIISELRRLS